MNLRTYTASHDPGQVSATDSIADSGINRLRNHVVRTGNHHGNRPYGDPNLRVDSAGASYKNQAPPWQLPTQTRAAHRNFRSSNRTLAAVSLTLSLF